MSEVIWKKMLDKTDSQRIMLPHDAEILCAREQHGELCIWFKCSPDAAESPRFIRVYGTGHQHQDGIEGRYLGTCMFLQDQLVLHVFEDAA